jgi:chorismate-pyruvate lyase
MKIYTLTQVQDANYEMQWAFTKIVFASGSITKVIEHAKKEYGVEIQTLDFLELDAEEFYGYKVEEINIEMRNK